MSNIYKGLALLLVLGLQAMTGVVPMAILGLLLIVALWVYREKYANHTLIIAIEYLLVLAVSALNPLTLILSSPLAFDLAARGLSLYIVLLVPAGLIYLQGEYLLAYGLLLIYSALSGYLSYTLQKKAASFREVYDSERRNRYSLEEAKSRLMHSAREAAHLAEMRERNRIARDIHDHVGHNLAGILLQMQVIEKLTKKDPEKARELLAQSISGLADAVKLIRETVHNLKPREQLGLDYIENIISMFKFCEVDFKHHGDIAVISASHTEIISSIIKEALTNAARHSNASFVEIELDVRERIVRLFIQDNGSGCGDIKEGMGISGMKERVRNAAGSLTINATDGFSIVCVLPREEKEGGAALEGADR
ncbi:MAG: sensor histidine kinase [Firmicutes bacterium]|nr:sensor histidine kinase [Bacillota bacterium]